MVKVVVSMGNTCVVWALGLATKAAGDHVYDTASDELNSMVSPRHIHPPPVAEAVGATSSTDTLSVPTPQALEMET